MPRDYCRVFEREPCRCRNKRIRYRPAPIYERPPRSGSAAAHERRNPRAYPLAPSRFTHQVSRIRFHAFTSMKRILTAIVALPILLYAVWSRSPYFFVALTAIAIVLALGEFYNLASKAGGKPQTVPGYAAALVVIAGFVFEEPALTVAAVAAISIASIAAG